MIEVNIQYEPESFIKENGAKINQIATDLDIIATKVSRADFSKDMKHFDIKTVQFWSMISDAEFICRLDNEHWWNFGNWSALLDDYDETIKGFVGYFKEKYPELF